MTHGWLVAARKFVDRRRPGRPDDPALAGSDGAPAHGRRLASRLTFLGLILPVLALFVSAGLAFGASADAGDASRTAPAAPQEPEGVEVRSARTETSDTYRLPGGSFETRLFPGPVNYEEGGSWKPIEPDLKWEPGAGFSNGGAGFELHLPGKLGAGAEKVTIGERWIASRLLGEESGTPVVAGPTASYEAPRSEASFEVTSEPTGVDEEIILEGPSAPAAYSYELSASEGVGPELEADGSISFTTASGETLASLPAPAVSEGAATPAPVGGIAHYALSPTGSGHWRLTVSVDQEWLEAPARKFPVTIDPPITIEHISTWENCTIDDSPAPEGTTMCALYGAAEDWAMFNEGTGADYRTFIGFSTAGIPADSSVASAAVHLYEPRSAESTKALELYEVIRQWDTTANWRYSERHGGTETAWTTPGGDLQLKLGEVTTATRGTGAGPWVFESPALLSVVASWVSKGTKYVPNYGVAIKQSIENRSQCEHGGGCVTRAVAFDSSNATEESKRPYLSLTYYPQAPLSSKMSSPTEGTHTARRLKLAARWAVGGVEGVTYQYREGKTGPFQTIPTELVRTADGKTVSWPLPVGFAERETKTPVYLDAAHLTPTLRKKGGVVQVRALFEGPTEVAGYSAPVEAVVDRLGGGPKDPSASVGPGSVDLLTGNFTTSSSDVSIPSYNSSLEFSRTFTSRRAPANAGGDPAEKKSYEELRSPLGPGWTPGVPIEEAGGSNWHNLRIVEEPGSYEEYIGEEEAVVRQYSFTYAELTTDEGEPLDFEKTESGYVAPPEATGWTLVAQEGNFVLSDPVGDRTTFSRLGEGTEYVPIAISMAGGSPTKTSRVEYALLEGGKKRVHWVAAPAAPGVTCETYAQATTNEGCRALVLNYAPATNWGAPASDGERLASITYYAPGNGGHWEVANYEYDNQGRLAAEWDPRVTPEPLKTRYTYNADATLKTVTPPGQEPWTLEYASFDEEEGPGRLVAVKRPSLLSSPTTAQTTIAYEVPLEGPYEMGPSKVAQWGQIETPTDATAVIPPSSEPGSYSQATIYYMDAEGQEVNTATPKGAGTSQASISTRETDPYGNVVRELTADNRLRVLAEPECKNFAEEGCRRRIRGDQLETRRAFGPEGIQLEEEEGPEHQIRLESGTTTTGRLRRVIQYDHEMPVGTTPDPHLPTRETTDVSIGGVAHEERVTETKYDWTLRRPERSITVMGSGKPSIESVTLYNDETGQVTETRQPKGAGGETAGDTRTVYFKVPKPAGERLEQCESQKYAGLPCKVEPAVQLENPKLLVTKYLEYNGLGEPMVISESPGGGTENVRQMVIAYDKVGRVITKKLSGGGVELPPTETIYNEHTGLPEKQQFHTPGSEPTKIDTTHYNALGQVTEYEDADGNQTRTTYDIDGRPSTVTDSKGSQTYHYDETSGLLTSLEDSGAGTFTASYDADGNMVERTLPNGITARTTYNEVDEPMTLAYTKTSSCGESCTWYEETLERSVEGRILSGTSSLVKDRYSYDKAGRLTEAQETPTGGECTSRAYTYDADSNRLTKTTRNPGLGGACATSGGNTQSYGYDGADRLIGPTYDAWGRITSLPAEFAGGKALTTEYFADDMVAMQSQGGVTNTFQLDATGRQRQREQTGGVAGVEVFHYDGPGDSPSWTSLGSTWSRNVPGIGSELAAVQESDGTTTFELTDLHGDVVATASSSPAATALLTTSRFSEFGEPETGTAGRFGWLGGKSRRTELSSGVIQMGARSYIPQLGRFLTPDPVRGGSANAYDYADQDPVNSFDLGGTCAHAEWDLEVCAGQSRGHEVARVRAKTHHIAREHHLSTPVVKSRRCTAVACRVGWSSGTQHKTGPVEHIASAMAGFLAQHAAPTVRESHEFLETWAGSGGYSNEAIVGCAKAATEAWRETAYLRAGPNPGEDAIGYAASALYSAVQCGVGALP